MSRVPQQQVDQQVRGRAGLGGGGATCDSMGGLEGLPGEGGSLVDLCVGVSSLMCVGEGVSPRGVGGWDSQSPKYRFILFLPAMPVLLTPPTHACAVLN